MIIKILEYLIDCQNACMKRTFPLLSGRICVSKDKDLAIAQESSS